MSGTPFEEGGRADEHFFMFRVATEALGPRGRDSARKVARFLESGQSILEAMDQQCRAIVRGDPAVERRVDADRP